MKLSRRYTRSGSNPLDEVTWKKRQSVISNPDGSVVFEAKDVEVPEDWSQLATDIMVAKYFRKAGVPNEKGRETSAREVVHRLARTIADAGRNFGGYFDTPEDADIFEAELAHMLIHQIGAFNSPVWFNCGLSHQYGIKGAPGNQAWDFDKKDVVELDDAYKRPQCSACFIQSVDDDLMSIFDLVKSEARIFKYGSGTGTNFSRIRGKQEKLSGGGTSSGLMSFLEVFDRGAGATKSGGTTRRAAKMVCLDMDHPEIRDFINWKVREERKARVLIEHGGLPADFNGEAYHTVAGQNSNNSVRVSDEFMQAVTEGKPWQTTFRTDPGKVCETLDAAQLFNEICEAAWACADPGVQFDSTINDWHTCSATDRIHASNPCVTGDTLVATSRGYRRIRELVGQNTEIINGFGRKVRASRIFKTGHKPVFELKTRSGYSLRLTADHKVMTANRGDVPAAELTRDDHVLLERPGFGDESVPEAFGELVGAAVGDGSLGTGANDQEFLFIASGRSEEAVADRLRSNIDECKRWVDVADNRSLRPSSVVRTATGFRVGSSVRALLDEVKACAVLDAGSESKLFTDRIFGMDSRSQAAVLRGLFTADGTVADYGDKSQYVALDSTSLELLRQVQLLLLGFGIKAKIYENRRVLGQTESILPDGKGGHASYPVQQMHSLRISRASRLLFEREIGFMPESAKASRLHRLNSRVAAYREHLSDPVASLVPCGQEDVFDLTEPASHHFVANGIVVHNCSEYMFLDDSACNLSSINLMKLIDDDGDIDVEAYRHAIRIFFLAQEILVDFSSYPTPRIARNSHDYRPLGLGYANLGAMLMVNGIPYDSPEGVAVCGAVTAILTGHAYRVSAEMAASKGPFPGHPRNEKPMMRVMKKHRAAVDRISGEFCPSYLHNAARAAWDEAIEAGAQHGFRNAQATVLAPTGTIGLLMDCDTTGIEPDFSLVKIKKLAGGGYFKIVNQSVPRALRRLGYESREIQDILVFINGTMTLRGAPHINDVSLKARGFTDDELARVESALRGATELSMAFSRWTLGNEVLSRLGISEGQASGADFSLLKAIGFTDAQIAEADIHVCGTMTIEGAPHIREEHLPVFDCANKCGKTGRRFIAPMGHVRMMGAAQPFISGAISKTVNVPNEATVADIHDIYMDSWKLGLKAIALYRDGCKMSQPLSSRADDKKKKSADADTPAAEVPAAPAPPALPAAPAPLLRGQRRRLPARRLGATVESRVAGHKVFLRTGEFEDGQLGEIFIDMHKEGAAFRSMMNCFAIAVSKGLQYGVPLSEFVDTFTFTRFEPQGPCDHPNIKMATSVVDYIFRALGLDYLGRTDLVQVKPDAAEQQMSATGSASEAEAMGEPHGRAASPAASPQSGAQYTGTTPSTGIVAPGVGPAAPAAGPAPLGTAPHIPGQSPSGTARPGATGAMMSSTGSASPAAQPARAPRPASALDSQLGTMMGDAPFCDVCGHLTVRNGACYKCLNCGNSIGCS